MKFQNTPHWAFVHILFVGDYIILNPCIQLCQHSNLQLSCRKCPNLQHKTMESNSTTSYFSHPKGQITWISNDLSIIYRKYDAWCLFCMCEFGFWSIPYCQEIPRLLELRLKNYSLHEVIFNKIVKPEQWTSLYTFTPLFWHFIFQHLYLPLDQYSCLS